MFKASNKAWFVLFFLAACATTPSDTPKVAKTKTPGQHKIHYSDLSDFDLSKDREDSVDVAGDDDESSDTDKSEGTPEDLGDVEFSKKRNSEEVTADALASKTFPLVSNEFVDQWIRYFTGRGRPTFERWLARSTRYIPAMKKVLREEGLPEDLIYLAMIESGFNPKASSHAKAVGPWQFMKGTGQRYKLEVGYWLDQRRDFVKSTFAAAKYLRELYQIFGSWYLAAASYNAGEGKVLNAIHKDHSRSFWELCRTKKNFRAETRNYVPKIIAAALISKNPEKYGFMNLPYENPFTWASVKVASGVDLRQVADIVQVDKEELLQLNSELRRGITPPQEEAYPIKVPPEKKELLVAHLSELKTQKLNKYFITHKVRRGDTLASIGHRYGASIQSLLDINDLKRKQRLHIGMEISVPIGDSAPHKASFKRKLVAAVEKATPGRAEASTLTNAQLNTKSDTKPSANAMLLSSNEKSPTTTKVAAGGTYVIQDGDTLWNLSQKWGVTVKSLRKVNKISSSRSLRPGQTLVIPSS